MEGENFVILKGKISYPSLKTVGVNNTSLFKASVGVPMNDPGKFQYVKVAAWRSVAESLGELPQGTFIKAHGHIEERSYDGKCKHCGGYDKKFWTEVIIDSFTVEEV